MIMPDNFNNNQTDLEDIFSEVTDDKIEINPTIPASSLTPQPTTIKVRTKRIGKKDWLLIIFGVIFIVLLITAGILFFLKKQVNNSLVNTNSFLLEIINVNSNLNSETQISENSNVNIPVFIDTDHDGLSDEQEKQYNTDIAKKDTDQDGLTDREEIKVYLTDPLNPDTDQDGYNDGDEVKAGYSPKGSGKLF
jgi:hypothetical protein